MMKAKITLYIFLVVVLFASCSKIDTAPNTGFTNHLDSLFNTVPDFSGVVLVAENGKPLYHKGFGFQHFETKDSVDTTSIFELASLSKQFTAMIIMMLKEEGRLAYDDAIEKYIPGFPYPGIMIRHLLNHTSGLPDYQALMDQYWDKSRIAGNKDNIEYLKRYHPVENFSPREKYQYSNTGYMLLASIAENISGTNFMQLCREKIFNPLKMKQTDIRSRENRVQLTNTAWGHIYVPEKKQYVNADSFPAFNYTIWLGNRVGPGRVSATASDLLKWDRALYGEDLIKKATLADAFTPAKLKRGTTYPYGFGWMLAKHPQLGTKIFHTGDNPGYKTIIIRYTDARKTLIVLCNNGHPKFDWLVQEIERSMSPVDSLPL